MNKKGEGTGGVGVGLAIALASLVIFIAALSMYAQISEDSGITRFISNIGLNPNEWGNVGQLILDSFNFVKTLVVPASTGLSEDQSAIAFAMFLLVLIIGTRALTQAFSNGFLAFGVAALVSAIASRSLTPIIIEQYISPSPVAASAFLIGVLPLFAIYGFMKNFRPGNSFTSRMFVKFSVWVILAVTYHLIFTYAFHSVSLGITYFTFILISGTTETLLPLFRKKRFIDKAIQAGKTAKELALIEKKLEGIDQGYHKGGIHDSEPEF